MYPGNLVFGLRVPVAQRLALTASGGRGLGCGAGKDSKPEKGLKTRTPHSGSPMCRVHALLGSLSVWSPSLIAILTRVTFMGS